ncbi:hypothetical protein MPTK1_6g14850 [Marchantia polymorpha subsp. ruderalis]
MQTSSSQFSTLLKLHNKYGKRKMMKVSERERNCGAKGLSWLVRGRCLGIRAGNTVQRLLPRYAERNTLHFISGFFQKDLTTEVRRAKHSSRRAEHSSLYFRFLSERFETLFTQSGTLFTLFQVSFRKI